VTLGAFCVTATAKMAHQAQYHQQQTGHDMEYAPDVYPATSNSYQYDSKHTQYLYAETPTAPLSRHQLNQQYQQVSNPDSTASQQPTQAFLDQQRPALTPWSTCLWEWTAEIAWVVFSVLMLIALVVVLKRFDGVPMPRWSAGVTLNTVIALLSTLARSAFIIPCIESVSQLKWVWFRRERPLGDLQVFDEASRGPWGSIKLLFVTRGW
jgi:hypothetical protein